MKYLVQVKNPITGEWSKMEFGPFNAEEAIAEMRWLKSALGGEFRIVPAESEPVVHAEQWA